MTIPLNPLDEELKKLQQQRNLGINYDPTSDLNPLDKELLQTIQKSASVDIGAKTEDGTNPLDRFLTGEQPGKEPLFDSPFLDKYVGRGATRGLVELVPQTAINVSKLAEAAYDDPAKFGKTLYNAGVDFFKPAVEDPGGTALALPGNAVKMLWHGFVKPLVVTPAELMWDWMGDPTTGIDNPKLKQQIQDQLDNPNLYNNDKERYAKAQESAAMWATLAMGKVISKLVGPEASANGVLAQLSIPKTASATEVLTKYIPEAVSKMGVQETVDLMGQTRAGIGSLVKRGLAEGGGSGAFLGLMERADNGEEVARNVFSYGLAGGILGTTMEVGMGGFRKITKGTITPRYNQQISMSIGNQLMNNLVDSFTPEVAPIVASQLASGLDVVNVVKSGLRRDATITLEGIPHLTPEQLADPTIGKWVNPETGLYKVLLQGEGVLEAGLNENRPRLTFEDLHRLTGDESLKGKTGDLVVYHGSPKEVPGGELAPAPVLGGVGIYTSASPEFTKQFSIGAGDMGRTVNRTVEAPNTFAFNVLTTPDKVLTIPNQIGEAGFQAGGIYGDRLARVPTEALIKLRDAAQRLTEKYAGSEQQSLPSTYSMYKYIAENPDKYTPEQVKEATGIIDGTARGSTPRDTAIDELIDNYSRGTNPEGYAKRKSLIEEEANSGTRFNAAISPEVSLDFKSKYAKNSLERLNEIIAAREAGKNPNRGFDITGITDLAKEAGYDVVIFADENPHYLRNNGAKLRSVRDVINELYKIAESGDVGVEAGINKFTDALDRLEKTENKLYDKLSTLDPNDSNWDYIQRNINMNVAKAKEIYGSILTKAGHTSNKIKPHEVAVMNPDVLVQPWRANSAGTIQTYSPSDVRFFNKNGFVLGETANYKGADVIIADVAKDGKVEVYNAGTGEKLLVDKSELSHYNKPDMWKVSKTNEGEIGFIPRRSLGPEKKYLSDEWNKIFNELDTEGQKFVLENKKVYEAANYGKKAGTINTLLALGKYVERNGDGGWNIKDVVTGNIEGKVKTFKELETYRNSLSTPPTLAEAIEGVQAPLMIPTGSLTSEAATPTKLYDRLSARNVVDKINLFVKPIVPKIELLRSFSRRTSIPEKGIEGINLTPEYHKLTEAVLVKRAQVSPYINRLNRVMTPVVMHGSDMVNLWERALTTRSAAEIRRFGIRENKLPMSEAELNYANKLEQLLPEYEQRQAALRYATEKGWIEDSKTMAEATKEKLLKELDAKVEPTPEQIEWADLYRSIHDGDRLTITEYINAKELNTPDRATFLKDNNLPPEVVSSIYSYEVLMNDLAKSAGVSTEFMLNGYMPRIAKNMGTTNIDGILSNQSLGDSQRQFGNLLRRVGYRTAEELIQDPLNASAKYISGVFHHQQIEPALKAIENKLKRYRDMAEADPNGKGIAWSNQLDGIATVVKDIKDIARNVPDPIDVARKSSARAMFDKLSGSSEKTESLARYWNQALELKFQGFKPMAAIRDMNNFVMAHGMFFGLKGAGRVKNLFTVADEAWKHGKNINESGLTPTLTPTRFEGVDIRSAKGGWDNLVNTGFKWSMQPQVYRISYNLSYLEASKTIANAMTKLKEGKIDRLKFEKEISLSRYDGTDIQHFNDLIDSGNNLSAVDYLARRTGESVVGLYGTLNAPSFFKSSFGKVAGQFGQWGLWMTQNVARNLSTGSAVDRAATLGFLGGTAVMAHEVKDKFGVGLASWLFSPTQLLPSGSPAVSAVFNAAEIASDPSQIMRWAEWKRDNVTDFFTDPTEENLGYVFSQEHMPSTVRNITNVATPIPLELQKINEAINRYQLGQPLHVVGWTLLGGSGIDPRQYPRPR